MWVASFKIPSPESFNQRVVVEPTKIYDRTGEIMLYETHPDIKRTILSFDQISRNVKNATIAIEDAEFYQHHGVRPLSFLRAVIANISSGSFQQGGSTITQQVVKNSILTKEKTITRKLKEWVLAFRLEQILSKEEILAMYLNESPYGGTIYGIEEASRAYLGKKASDLTVAESAYLASLPNAPTYYSPYGNHKDKLEERKNLVLQKMLDNNFITEEEYNEALAEKVVFRLQGDTSLKAPHFVFYVKEYLEQKYGREAVESQGLKVITTLDYSLEQKAEEVVKRWALSNKKNFNAENASLVAIEAGTGQILVMVGSRDYFDEEIDGNFNATLSHRQPGSAFKPFVYATAFMKGYTPETTVFDLKTEFSTFCNPDGSPILPEDGDKCYQPVNYDGIYRGPVTLRNALAQSINIPAIKVLYLAGLKDSLQVAKDMGINSLDKPDRYGLTLVLGGGEVSLFDITSAYSVFANKGVRNNPVAILEIRDKNNNLIERYQQKPYRVLPEEVTLTISDVLSDNKARAPAFGENSYLNFPNQDVAVKTGTTNDYRDAWIIGYTPKMAVGAWAGNNNNSPMEKKVAGFIIAPLWNEFVQIVLASSSPSEKFEKPEEKDLSVLKPVLRGFWQGNKSYFIDSLSGKLATANTPKETRMEMVVKEVHSILYWVDRNNPLGEKPVVPSNDPQFDYWEYAVRKWVTEQGIFEETEAVIPTAQDDIHVPENYPKLSLSGITIGKEYAVGERVFFQTNSIGRYPLKKVDYFVNNKFIGSTVIAPFNYSFVPEAIDGIETTNTLKAVGYDSVYNQGEVSAVFNVSFVR